ncbi:MAG TPA: ATP-grasp domain-containing protein, partial [Dongiaceae bacterium]|nr:ATP-grasp domain-containing protein [Dongiaceae bacterium]
MAEPPAYLLVALSGRALAVAAGRSGRRAFVLDLFGDTDTRSHAADSLIVAGSLEHGFDQASLLAGTERLAPAGSRPPYGLVYGSGLEDRPQLLAALGRGRRLYGNLPETVRLTKDPRVFFAQLDRLKIPHPAVSFTRPPDPEDWLVKRIGASGGSHVTAAAAATTDLADRYYQRRATGRAIGVSFLADGRRAFLLGCSEQWAWNGDTGSFRFGGALQPAPLGSKLTGELPGLVDAIARAFGLVGLNSLDLLVDGENFAVIEVNPRPGANLDIFDGYDPAGLFGLHLRACEGELPSRWQVPPRATAMAVVYADRPARVPAD